MRIDSHSNHELVFRHTRYQVVKLCFMAIPRQRRVFALVRKEQCRGVFLIEFLLPSPTQRRA